MSYVVVVVVQTRSNNKGCKHVLIFIRVKAKASSGVECSGCVVALWGGGGAEQLRVESRTDEQNDRNAGHDWFVVFEG